VRKSRLPLRALRVVPLLLVAALARCGGDTVTSPTPTFPLQSIFPATTGETAVLLAAGDVAVCGSTATHATGRLLDGLPGTVITLGDNAYPSGSAESFRDCYDPTWGRHLGYYRFRLGDWQVYSLNSNVSMGAGSSQLQWLQRELSVNSSRCTLAYWHHPLFTSGRNGDNPATRSLWRVLYDFDADVVISAHDHLYERFAPQDPDGRPDPYRGIRQFIVGTGGAPLTSPVGTHINSDVVWSIHGVLEMVLRPDSYTWRFVSEAGVPADIGAGMCHTPAPPDAGELNR
jgi:hypothetical protein